MGLELVGVNQTKPEDASAQAIGKSSNVTKNTAASSATPADKSGKILIRFVEARDKEAARNLLKQLHVNSIFAEHAFSDKKFDQHAKKIFSRPKNMACLVAELDGAIVGLIWASAGSYSLSQDLVLATCHVIAIDTVRLGSVRRAKCFLRLIKAVQKWSKTCGAKQVLVHVTTGTSLTATDRLLRRSGAKIIGGGYVV